MGTEGKRQTPPDARLECVGGPSDGKRYVCPHSTLYVPDSTEDNVAHRYDIEEPPAVEAARWRYRGKAQS